MTAALRDVIQNYDLLLLDIYGVLITARGPCPGAVAFIDHLNHTGKPYRLLSNDASSLPATRSLNLEKQGMHVAPENIITSGMVIADYFREKQLQGSRCGVLGTEDSCRYVQQAGGIVIDLFSSDTIDVLVICDDIGYPFKDGINAAINAVIKALDQDRQPILLLPNPDIIFPVDDQQMGVTAGAVSLVIEAALTVRYGVERMPRFVPLGKPFPAIYDHARRLAPDKRLLMIGDQIATDIAGARRAGIDSVLITQGVSRIHPDDDIQPTYHYSSLLP